jgi:hypothetical protein
MPYAYMFDLMKFIFFVIFGENLLKKCIFVSKLVDGKNFVNMRDNRMIFVPSIISMYPLQYSVLNSFLLDRSVDNLIF